MTPSAVSLDPAVAAVLTIAGGTRIAGVAGVAGIARIAAIAAIAAIGAVALEPS